MLYAIISTDIENSGELRKQHRPLHLQRIQRLNDEGRLLLAGPHPAVDAEDPGVAGMTGSLVVAQFGSLDEANAWAEEDPFLLGGVYQTSIVKPFKQVLP